MTALILEFLVDFSFSIPPSCQRNGHHDRLLANIQLLSPGKGSNIVTNMASIKSNKWRCPKLLQWHPTQIQWYSQGADCGSTQHTLAFEALTHETKQHLPAEVAECGGLVRVYDEDVRSGRRLLGQRLPRHHDLQQHLVTHLRRRAHVPQDVGATVVMFENQQTVLYPSHTMIWNLSTYKIH